MTNNRELNELGWSEAYEAVMQCGSADFVARVVAVDRDQWLLVTSTATFRAKLAGSYLHHHHRSQDMPCVGDWVCVQKLPEDDFGVIHALLERRTFLRRKTAGNAIDYQMIAANVDYVFIVQSCQFDFNIKRMERYLVMVREGGAEPYILLTKTDLVDPSILAKQIAEISAARVTAPIMTLSTVSGEGIEELNKRLMPGKTYCFVGSSGVGKSTLINRLIGRERLETSEVSGTGEGRHTTVRRELILLSGGALVIDNPGMREFGILGAESGIEKNYEDIITLASRCRYRNCTHTNEPGCAVRKAVEEGTLSQQTLETYFKLSAESTYNEMSYAEKRKKDREFGKYIKSAKKDLTSE